MIRKFLALLIAFAFATVSSSSAGAKTFSEPPTDFPRVHFVPGSDINLLSSSSNIPIRIENDYANDVVVHVHAITTNGRLVVPAAIEVKIPARTTITAKLPVTATGVGRVDLVVWLKSFSGHSLNEKTIIKVNVNADAETTMIVSFAVVVSVLGTLGFMRTMRKRRENREVD